MTGVLGMGDIVNLIGLIFSIIFGIAFIGIFGFIAICTVIYSIKDLIEYEKHKKQYKNRKL